MRNIHLVVLTAFFTLILSSCSSLTPNEKIVINVQPFYNSEGPVIRVGDLSKELAADRPEQLLQTSQAMQTNISRLTPEQMYVAAVRLFDSGERDKALYWFYQAQYRARLYNCTLNKEHPDTKDLDSKAAILARTYRYFYVKIEPQFSRYAHCDSKQWEHIVEQVQRENRVPTSLATLFPALPFHASKTQSCNEQMTRELAVLKRYIKREQAAEKTEQPRYCS